MNKRRVNTIESRLQSLQKNKTLSRYKLDFTKTTTEELVEAIENIEDYRLCFYLHSKLIYFLSESFLKAIGLDVKQFNPAPKDILFSSNYFLTPAEVVEPLINTLGKLLIIEIKE
jgi:hypothetical protein